MKNRHGYDVALHTLKSVEFDNDGAALTVDQGYTFWVSADELDGFFPEEGDVVVLYTRGFSQVAGISINHRVIRYNSPAQLEADHEQWKKNYRLQKLERYLSEGAELKERVSRLHPSLAARMDRFARESGEDFWIDSAGYEMYALEGASALLKKTEGQTTESAIEWIDWWWSLNSAEHDYDYKRQMAELPEFGDGHSGNTAGAAYAIAKAVLRGEEV